MTFAPTLAPTFEPTRDETTIDSLVLYGALIFFMQVRRPSFSLNTGPLGAAEHNARRVACQRSHSCSPAPPSRYSPHSPPQSGFAMLEAGSVREGAISNIIFKNFIDAAIAGLLFWIFGYGLAYGDGKSTTDEEAFLGVGNVALSTMGQDRVFASYESWFFQFTFAATAATIVSGCIAERAKLFGYVIISSILTVWTYPIVVHWVWDTEGWISAFNPEAVDKFGCVRFPRIATRAVRHFCQFATRQRKVATAVDTTQSTSRSPPSPTPHPASAPRSYGMIDFAGSGVVHMVGGIAGLIGAVIIGGRKVFRDDGSSYNPMFEKEDGTKLPFLGIKARAIGAYLPIKEQAEKLQPSSRLFIALGTGILWFGWYGFNCGSALGVSEVSARVAVTTTLAACGGVLSGFAAGFVKDLTWEVNNGMNGALAGLVSITASCSVVEPWAAFWIGAIGGVVYVVASHLVYVCGIDDPVGGASVHGFAGMWGVLSVAIFGDDETIAASGYSLPDGYEGFDKTAEHFGKRLGGQVLGIVVIAAWTTFNAVLIFAPLRLLDLAMNAIWKPDGSGPTACVCIGHGVGLRVHPKTEQIGIDIAEHLSSPSNLEYEISKSPTLGARTAPAVGDAGAPPPLDLEAAATPTPMVTVLAEC